MIATKGLTKSFKSLVVLKGLDLSVARGTVLALLGPNGAGKNNNNPDPQYAAETGWWAGKRQRL